MTRLTLREAAARSHLTYGQVYRRVVQHREVPSRREPDGSYTISADDVHLLKPRVAQVDNRRGVTLRISHDEYAAWARVAGSRGVSRWLLGLARAASGWEG